MPRRGRQPELHRADYIVATALRDVNTIVYNEIKALVEGTWEPACTSAALPRAP